MQAMERINAAHYLTLQMLDRGWTCRAVDPADDAELAVARSTEEAAGFWRTVNPVGAIEAVVLTFQHPGREEPPETIGVFGPTVVIDEHNAEAIRVSEDGELQRIWHVLANSGALCPENRSTLAEHERARYAFYRAMADWMADQRDFDRLDVASEAAETLGCWRRKATKALLEMPCTPA